MGQSLRSALLWITIPFLTVRIWHDGPAGLVRPGEWLDRVQRTELGREPALVELHEVFRLRLIPVDVLDGLAQDACAEDAARLGDATGVPEGRVHVDLGLL